MYHWTTRSKAAVFERIDGRLMPDAAFVILDLSASLSMPSLRTFTCMKPFYYQIKDEWTVIDMLTSSELMSVLKRAHFICGITSTDLDRIAQSMVFNDDRNVDVHYAVLLNDNRLHADLTKHLRRGSRSHPRSIASATFDRDIVAFMTENMNCLIH